MYNKTDIALFHNRVNRSPAKVDRRFFYFLSLVQFIGQVFRYYRWRQPHSKSFSRGLTMLNNGFVGMLFDFNRDGKLDGFEQADVFAAFMSVMEDSVSSNREDKNDSNDLSNQ